MNISNNEYALTAADDAILNRDAPARSAAIKVTTLWWGDVVRHSAGIA